MTLLPVRPIHEAAANPGRLLSTPSRSGTSSQEFYVSAADPAAFSTTRVAALRHNFHAHPLMQLPELARLAQTLMPADQCRFLARGVTAQSPFDASLRRRSPGGISIDEVFQRIDEPGMWVALYNVECDPRYRAFLDDVMRCAAPLVEESQPGIFKVNGYVFISAPPAYTPFHIDRENNLWLQMRGRKTITVWDHADRDVVAAVDVEKLILYGSLEGVRFKESVRERGRSFCAGPGDGVYFPATSPHATESLPDWVTPGNGVSVSVGVVFYSAVTLRHARIHQVNHVLRRHGIEPRFPGQSAWRDHLKAPLGALLAAIRNPPPGTTSWSFGRVDG